MKKELLARAAPAGGGQTPAAADRFSSDGIPIAGAAARSKNVISTLRGWIRQQPGIFHFDEVVEAMREHNFRREQLIWTLRKMTKNAEIACHAFGTWENIGKLPPTDVIPKGNRYTREQHDIGSPHAALRLAEALGLQPNQSEDHL